MIKQACLQFTQELLRSVAADTEIENPLLAVEHIREKLRQCFGIVHAHAEGKGIAEKDDRRTLLAGNGLPNEIGIDCVIGNIDGGAGFRVPPFGMEAPGMFRSPADDVPGDRPAFCDIYRGFGFENSCHALNHE